MNNNMITNKVRTACPRLLCKLTALPVGVLGLALLSSCSDWDDHYGADTALVSSQSATLWQNISSQPNLSQFAALLKATGYDEVLSQSQTYTVWAPEDGTFDYARLSTESSDKLVREFIQNHIARSNYVVSGSVDEKIYMLNEKLMPFEGNGSYTISGVTLDQSNIGSSNGTLHTIGSYLPFMANIYESLSNDQYPIDSISDFFHAYEQRELDELRSVQGPVVDGEITYLDSVFYENNTLFNSFRAYINQEDSNYTMVLPTNEAWHRARRTIARYYHYLPSFDFMENTSTGEEKKVTAVHLKDAAFLTDSMTNMMLVRGLIFNNNLYDNKRLMSLQTGQRLQCDSLYSTTYDKLFADDAAQLFEGTQRVDKSNGDIFVTDDSLRMHTWSVWNPELRQEAEMSSLMANTMSAASANRVYVSETTQNPAVAGKVSGSYYLEVVPSASNANPEVDFYLQGVRSAEYALYLVVVPANIINPNRELKPHRMVITLGNTTDAGRNREERLRNPEDGGNYFVNDSSRIDTMFIGNVTFPIAYVGTGSSQQEYYPYLRVRSNVTNALSSQYDRTLRIDKIILRPRELDDYLKAHPDYKYDDGTY